VEQGDEPGPLRARLISAERFSKASRATARPPSAAENPNAARPGLVPFAAFAVGVVLMLAVKLALEA
jgi:hypothetical protein